MSQGDAGRNGGSGDGVLVQAYASSRSAESLRFLVDRHSRMVRGVCALYLRGNPGLADEAARAAFLLLTREAESLGKDKKLFLASWLHNVAVLAASTVRSQNPQSAERNEDSGAVLSSEGRESLHKAIRSLPLPQREPLILSCLCGVSNEEISLRLDLPQSEIRSRIDNGRLNLCRKLESAGMDATEASVAGWLDDEAKAMADASGRDGGRALVSWKECSADLPMGKVSQSVSEVAGRVAGQMARAVVGRMAGLAAAAVAVVAIAGVAVVLLRQPEANVVTKPKEVVTMQVASVSGGAVATGSGGEATPLKAGDPVNPGTVLRTDRGAELTVTQSNGSQVLLRENTEVDVAFDKDQGNPVLLLKRGVAVFDMKGAAAVRTEHVAASVNGASMTFVVGKSGNTFTRIDVEKGTVRCVREGVPAEQSKAVVIKGGLAACFGSGIETKALESDGHEFASAGGGVFHRIIMNDYETTGLRLDSPKYASMVTMWHQRSGELDKHFSGSKTVDAGPGKDEEGNSCWTIKAAKGKDGAEELIPVRAEGDVLWCSMQFAVKPGAGPVGFGLAGANFVPDSLPAGVKKTIDESTGAAPKIEPLVKTTWMLKLALVGMTPDGAPLYEYESKVGEGPVAKGWRAGGVDKIGIKFSGSEFRIYDIKGGVLDAAVAAKQE